MTDNEVSDKANQLIERALEANDARLAAAEQHHDVSALHRQEIRVPTAVAQESVKRLGWRLSRPG